MLRGHAIERWYFRVDHLDLIEAASEDYGVSPYLIASVIYVESRFRSEARSEVGAIGLMQLMPSTAEEMAHHLGMEGYSASKLANPEVNIRLGTTYLRHLKASFPTVELALAAYNAGPTLAAEWQNHGGSIQYPETRHFVLSVLHHQQRLRRLYPEWEKPPLGRE